MIFWQNVHHIIWEDAPRPYGDDHVTKIWNRKLIRVTSWNEGLKHMCIDLLSDYKRYLNQIWYRTQMLHYQHARMAKFTNWKSKMAAAAILNFGKMSITVNNSELDIAVCAKIGWQMHHYHAEMTHGQKSKLELFCVTSLLWWIKMYILNECREHNRCADVKAYKSSQLTNL